MKILNIGAFVGIMFFLVACGVQNESVDHVTEPVSTVTAEKFFNFSSTTFEGEKIDDQIFADYDITIVNVWGTFCGPCLIELPFLAEIDEMLPENINFLGICLDVTEEEGDENFSLGKEILNDKKIKYDNILYNDSLTWLPGAINNLIPTTLFIDSAGNQHGEPMVGAIVSEERILEFLERLKPYTDYLEWEGYGD